ncbi:MAG: cytochrome c-type biogenesis protein CcmI [Psychromonas sp.]|jgi:cytochrome c-type biogenesis protein CcmI|uniref:c-type cytochrome biogenesis protein CcmI n=1 Tax=Psychromonas sp. TaxID=1884585 RepID=UPI0039E25931
MILQFWIGVILLLIVACGVFVFSFIARKNKSKNEAARNLLNRNLYDIRLEEIEKDDQQGLIIDKEKIITELQHNLLDDTFEVALEKATKPQKWLWLPGVLVLILGSLGLYWSVGAYQQLDNWQNVLQRYPALQNKLFNDADSRPSDQDFRDIMLGLRTHLVAEPNDADGWLLYSRLGMVFNDAELALNAVQKAYLLDPDSVAIRLIYIELTMQMGDQYSQDQAEAMLLKLLKDKPDNLEAWSMYAFMAIEKQDFSSAIHRWQKMLTLVDENSQQAGILRDSIAYAKNKMTGSNKSTPALENSSEIADSGQESKVAPVGATYQVHVAIADDVNLPKNGFLFVFAQQVGAKMPIAALKMNITRFPVTVELSDANSMVEGNKLSLHSEFVIKARISSDGSISSGTWQGQSSLIKAGEKQAINLLIAQPL